MAQWQIQGIQCKRADQVTQSRTVVQSHSTLPPCCLHKLTPPNAAEYIIKEAIHSLGSLNPTLQHLISVCIFQEFVGMLHPPPAPAGGVMPHLPMPVPFHCQPIGPGAASIHSSFCRAGKGSLFSGHRSGSPVSVPKNGLLLLQESVSLGKAQGDVAEGQVPTPGSSPTVVLVAVPFPFSWDWGRPLVTPLLLLLNSGTFAAPSVEPCQHKIMALENCEQNTGGPRYLAIKGDPIREMQIL